MGDDVVDLVRGDAGILERKGHRPGLAPPGRLRGADVERVGRQCSADDLGDGRRTALQGVSERLDDDDATTLTENESVARAVERPRRGLRRVVSLREGRHVGQGRHAHRDDRGFRTARQDDVAIARADQSQRVVKGDDRCRAGGDLGHDRPSQAVLDRQQRRTHRP